MTFKSFLRSLCCFCCYPVEDPVPQLPSFSELLDDADPPQVSSDELIRVELGRSPQSPVPIFQMSL